MESKYYLIIFALILYASYIPLNKRKSRYFWKSKLDFRIPYLSFFIIPYQFFFIFVAATFLLLWNSPFLTSFLLSTIIAELISIIVWFLFPNGVPRTEREEGGLLSKLVNFTYKHDKDTNGFPSGHVFNSLICS